MESGRVSSDSQALIVFPLTGGMDSTSSPSVVPPGFFTVVENGEYVVGRAPEPQFSVKKRLGTNKYNSVGITGTPAITSMAEFWRHGASLSPTQKFVACAGDMILKDDLDGTWDTLLASGFGSSTTESNITIAQGYAIFSNAGNQAPRLWDQTTLTTLGGSPPNFTASVYHLRRLWSVGDPAAPSRTQYTAAGDIADWSGADTGNIIFDEDDGDRLVGVSQPYQGRLYFFKGPNKGTIHEIGGTTPSTFTRRTLVTSIPCVSHGGIVTTDSDIFWPSRYGIHSMSATQKYGDIEPAYISWPIQGTYNNLNHARLNQIRGFYQPTRNVMGWLAPSGSNTQNDTMLVYNFAAKAWSVYKFSGLKGASVMVAQTPTTRVARLYVGGYAGFAFSGDQTTLSDFDATQGYTLKVQSPYHMKMSDQVGPLHEKQYEALTTFIRPTGDYTADISLSVDGRTQSDTIDLVAEGAVIGTFVIGTDKIGSAAATRYIERPIEDRGRGIQVEWRQSGANQDMEILGYAIRYAPGETFALEAS